jgi:polyphosphate kinase 2 PPK2
VITVGEAPSSSAHGLPARDLAGRVRHVIAALLSRSSRKTSRIAIYKFFLHVSRNEQKRRFLERLENPEKNWKFSPNDVRERPFWKDYMRAYEDAIRETAADHAPWYVVPADNKWFTRVVVAAAIIDTLAGLDLHYPKVSKDKRKELATAKRALERSA